MGTRSYSYYKCPACIIGEVEEYDAPSSLMFSATCSNCYWEDNSYYKEVKNSNGEYEIKFVDLWSKEIK